MKIDYDKKADAKYVRIKKGKISYTKEENDWLLFDCAKNGEVLGVEVLNASKNPVSIYTIRDKFVGFGFIQTKKLGKENDSLGLTVNYPIYSTENQLALA